MKDLGWANEIRRDVFKRIDEAIAAMDESERMAKLVQAQAGIAALMLDDDGDVCDRAGLTRLDAIGTKTADFDKRFPPSSGCAGLLAARVRMMRFT